LRERGTSKFILESADVVVITCAGAASLRLHGLRSVKSKADSERSHCLFNACYLDETAQDNEPLARFDCYEQGGAC
jgi:hypothetical protein